MNRCDFIGNLGRDPETRSFQDGTKVCNFSLAVSEKWKKDGERKERTEWINVAVFGALADVCGSYLRKGSEVFVSGKWRTRKWQGQDGQDRYTTECVLQGPQSILRMLGGKPQHSGGAPSGSSGGGLDDLDSEIPF